MITSEIFGCLKDGREVTAYKVTNSFGESVTILDYGASVHACMVRDRNGSLADVTLGVYSAEDLEGGNKEGSTMGRFANRIGRASYEIDGKRVILQSRRPGCLLHSGDSNFANQFFTVREIGDNTLECSLTDAGTIGFGCSVDAKVCFSFGDDHCLKIRYDLVPDGTTVLAPTNHSYFDLSGGKGVQDHLLQVNAGRIAVKDEYGVPWGETLDVRGTAYDFTEFQKIGAMYDDYYLLNDAAGGPSAVLKDPESGRMMEVFTDMPCIILYTPVNEKPADKPGKYGRYYTGAIAVCLETQYVPNSMNFEGFGSPIFRAGEHFRSETVYRFSTF